MTDSTRGEIVVLDTNVFVGAGFNESSASHQIVCRVDRGELALAWSTRTRRETKRILRQIPPLGWGRFASCFLAENRYRGRLDPDRYGYVADSMDRHFLALAEAVGTTLITNDSDLLVPRERAKVPVLTPSEYLAAGSLPA